MMSEHVNRWLEAYHDDELSGIRLQQVKDHLQVCKSCQVELGKLEALSDLLQRSPLPDRLTSPELFVAQVRLQLPRREQTRWQKILRVGWQISPLGILGVWGFIQSILIVSMVLMFALQLGVGGDLISGFVPPQSGASWLNEMISITSISDVSQFILNIFDTGNPFLWILISNIILPIIFGLLLCSWLASWWTLTQKHQSNQQPGYIR
ncbi:MAG: zf-HC2 domain-containing protein [Anaerolineaceae bacterium]|nr:zf-HC2 domain-containing protein [Anaerolineaceae bacterium]